MMSNFEPICFEDYLAKYGSLTYRNKGVSMMPLLRQDKDLFTVEKKGPERCKKYDVVLYKDKMGRYILHRIIKVVSNGYIIRGDNTYHNEFRTDSEILGVMTGFTRDEKEYKVADIGYKLYSVLRSMSYPVRFIHVKIRHYFNVILKKIAGEG